uniref:Uncharacterized protein n=1 Tax=Siphoviridae sp. ct6HQ3 TaxID=2825341 RepID=A0A8S5VA83_9CAUD|nr:MAG TPA: hypothetical protein [Siphoviridae sp. ct6HQ3]
MGVSKVHRAYPRKPTALPCVDFIGFLVFLLKVNCLRIV